MIEFMMIFRHGAEPPMSVTPEGMASSEAEWQTWITNIVMQNKFVSTNQLSYEGKTLKPGGVITDGPYAEVKELIGGYIIVKADNMDEAMKLAEGCPILNIGGHVEVRRIVERN